MAVTVSVAAEADLPALQTFTQGLDAQGNAWRCAVTVGPPTLEDLRRVFNVYRILIATDNGIRGWVAHRPDGVIKWLVVAPTPAARFRDAASALLSRVFADTGNLARGVVQNPDALQRLVSLGLDTEPHRKAGLTWVIVPEGVL